MNNLISAGHVGQCVCTVYWHLRFASDLSRQGEVGSQVSWWCQLFWMCLHCHACDCWISSNIIWLFKFEGDKWGKKDEKLFLHLSPPQTLVHHPLIQVGYLWLSFKTTDNWWLQNLHTHAVPVLDLWWIANYHLCIITVFLKHPQ